MKTSLITILIAGFSCALTPCSDFIERKPLPDEIIGKWEVTWIASSVKGWLANNGVHELPAMAGIEFHADGSFTATSLPYTLGNSFDKCAVINQRGKWTLIDSTADDDLVKWKIEVMPVDVNDNCRFNFHEDTKGIYLGNPIDWELPKSVLLRKITGKPN